MVGGCVCSIPKQSFKIEIKIARMVFVAPTSPAVKPQWIKPETSSSQQWLAFRMHVCSLWTSHGNKTLTKPSRKPSCCQPISADKFAEYRSQVDTRMAMSNGCRILKSSGTADTWSKSTARVFSPVVRSIATSRVGSSAVYHTKDLSHARCRRTAWVCSTCMILACVQASWEFASDLLKSLCWSSSIVVDTLTREGVSS